VDYTWVLIDWKMPAMDGFGLEVTGYSEKA